MADQRVFDHTLLHGLKVYKHAYIHITHLHILTLPPLSFPSKSLSAIPPLSLLWMLKLKKRLRSLTHWHLLCSALLSPLYIVSCWCDHIHCWQLMYAAVYLNGGGCPCTSPFVVCWLACAHSRWGCISSACHYACSAGCLLIKNVLKLHKVLLCKQTGHVPHVPPSHSSFDSFRWLAWHAIPYSATLQI